MDIDSSNNTITSPTIDTPPILTFGQLLRLVPLTVRLRQQPAVAGA